MRHLSQYQHGGSTASENQLICSPITLPSGTRLRGVIQGHGTAARGADPIVTGMTVVGGGWQQEDLEAFGSDGRFVTAWADYGHTTYGAPTGGFGTGGTQGQTNMGNPESVTSCGNMWTYLKTLSNVKTDKVILMGGSMGTLTVLNYAWSVIKSGATSLSSFCSAILLNIPLLDLYSIYSNNTGSRQGDIATAYNLGGSGVGYNPAISQGSWNGTAGQNAAITDSSPILYFAANSPSRFAGVPIGIWASDNDPFASNTAVCQAFAAQMNALGCNIQVFSVGSQGHAAAGYHSQKLAWAGQFA